jgi:hypothetical protein
LVVARDIKVSLADVELLTIRIRLLVCSIDKAEEIGLDWWRHDQYFSAAGRNLTLQNEELRERVRLLEQQLARIAPKASGRRGSKGSVTKEDR